MTHKSGDPTQKPDLPALPPDVLADEAIPGMFRLGDDTRNRETLADGIRVLSWRMRSDDVELAPVAGWDVFPLETEGGIGRLQLPPGTRSAYSVLSGLEAWSGEKKAVVERVSRYMGDIHARFGIYDTGFSWNQVGVTPDQHIFVAPPNTPVAVVQERQTAEWQDMAVDELGILLQSDTANIGLVELFTQSLQRD